MSIKHEKFVICLSNENHDDLEVWKVYRLLPDPRAAEVGCLRIVDESGEDYLYPSDCFAEISLTNEVKEQLLASVEEPV